MNTLNIYQYNYDELHSIRFPLIRENSQMELIKQ